jgi:ADP-ribose pyrophosphatase
VREAEEADIVLRWIPLDEALAAVLSGAVKNVGLTVAVLSAFASRVDGWRSLRAAE